MKRQWTSVEYRLRQARRMRRVARRAARQHKKPRQRHKRSVGGVVALTAPAGVLSLFETPEPTLEFCNQFRAAVFQRDARVRLDLAAVTQFSSDTLLLMRAITDSGRRGWRANVSGNMPSDPDVAAKFRESGFFHGFAKPPGRLPQPKGLMLRKSSRLVESLVAADLVRFALEHATIPRPIAVRSSNTLIEAMINTHNHATVHPRARARERRLRKAPLPWFAGVYCEDDVAYFTFVDLGVGILNSVRVKRFLKLIAVQLDLYGRADLLRDVFLGKVGSSTGDPGRGKGLPRMKVDTDAGLLPNLQVLTSSITGRVADLSFAGIGQTFNGTVLRWRSGEPPARAEL
jgi:hypothetical protein